MDVVRVEMFYKGLLGCTKLKTCMKNIGHKMIEKSRGACQQE